MRHDRIYPAPEQAEESKPAYRFYVDRVQRLLTGQGLSTAQAAQTAVGVAYRQLQLQATMLSYHNAFFVLSALLFVLVPLPFLMRLPKRV